LGGDSRVAKNRPNEKLPKVSRSSDPFTNFEKSVALSGDLLTAVFVIAFHYHFSFYCHIVLRLLSQCCVLGSLNVQQLKNDSFHEPNENDSAFFHCFRPIDDSCRSHSYFFSL